jgi:hypothetical protein
MTDPRHIYNTQVNEAAAAYQQALADAVTARDTALEALDHQYNQRRDLATMEYDIARGEAARAYLEHNDADDGEPPF